MSETWGEYIRRYFPRATDAQCDDILMSRTCFPFGRPARVKQQIQALPRWIRIAKKRGLDLCDFCNRPADSERSYLCVKCNEGWQKFKAEA